MEVPWSVQVHISALKNLPSSFVSELGSRSQFTLRVQGQLNGVSRETASSSWGARHTPRAGEAVWAGDGGLLEWRFGSEEAFRAAEKAAPVLKLYCYATLGGPGVGATPTNSKALGVLHVEVRSLRQGAKQWAKLRGAAAPAELLFAASVARVASGGDRDDPRPSAAAPAPSTPPRPPPESLPAKQLGRGSSVFELCVSLEGAGELEDLVGDELREAALRRPSMRYWFSFELLGVVVQSEQFGALTLDNPRFAVECDWFRLRCSAAELAAELSKPVDVFLCTDNLVVAAAALDLAPILPLDYWPPGRPDDEFHASEDHFRLDVVSRRPAHLLDTTPRPGRLDVFAAVRRAGADRDPAKAGPRGYVSAPPAGAEEAKHAPPPFGAPPADDYGDDAFEDEPEAPAPPPEAEAPPPVAPPRSRTPPAARTPPASLADSRDDADVAHDWRLELSLLSVTRSDGDEGPAEFRFAAPHLGQRGVAKTARLEFDTTTVACRGLGAVSHFEFRATANQLRMTLAPALVFEAVDAATRQLLGSAKVKLAAVLDAPGDPRAQFGDKAPRSWRVLGGTTHLLERESQVRDGSLLFGSLATRVALQRVDPNQLAKPNLDGARDASSAALLSEDLEDGLSETGERGGNLSGSEHTSPEQPPRDLGGRRSEPLGVERRSWEQQRPRGAPSGAPPGPEDGCCRYCGAAQPSLQEVADLKQELTLAFEAERRNWEAWRADEERAWALRLREKERQIVDKVERDAEERLAQDRNATMAHRQEYGRLEAKLRASLRDVEQRERALGDADAAMKRERASKVLDLQMLEKRLRDESKHSIEAEVRARKAVEKALSGARASLDRAEKRAVQADADFDRWRAAHRRTPEAELVARVAKAKAEAAEHKGRVERARAETAEAVAERERLRAHVHRLARALQRAKDDAADRARRDLDELKLEYKGKEERFVLDGDRKALGDIKAELDALRRRHVADEDRAKVAKNAAMEAVHYAMQNAPASPRGAPRPAPRHQSPRAVFDDAALDAINGNAAYAGGAAIPPRGAPVDDADNLARLVSERAVLVDEAGYPENDPLVRDLDRLIQAAAAE